jgi:hypothetical protein
MRGFSRMVWRNQSFVLADAAEVHGSRLQLADVIIHPVQPSLKAAAELAFRTLGELNGCLFVVVGVEGNGWLVQGRGAGGYVPVSPNRAARSVARGSPHSA